MAFFSQVPGAGIEPALPQWEQDFRTNYSFRCIWNKNQILWSGLSLHPIVSIYNLGVAHLVSTPFLILKIRTWLGIANPHLDKVSPNLSDSTLEVSFKALNLVCSLLENYQFDYGNLDKASLN